MKPYICIHGHFYQPPRENPWLDIVEPQDSASPWHDWNERVTAECYAPNAAARILAEDGKIVAIRKNYARMSFNMGPTLLTWMERARPDVYQAVIEADAEGMERFSGHGPALAQAYGRKGDIANADLAAANGYMAAGEFRSGQELAARAKLRFPPNSPGWLKADDILAFKPPKIDGQPSGSRQ